MSPFKDADIEGVTVTPLKFFTDKRGWLTELYREDELDPELHPVMCYISLTHPGVVRGPHEHREQTDYFVFNSSEFKLFLWDAREGSPTRMNRMVLQVGGKTPCFVIVPPGVVHAYKNVGGADGTVINLPNRLFAGHGKKEPVDEIRYEDDRDTIYRVDG